MGTIIDKLTYTWINVYVSGREYAFDGMPYTKVILAKFVFPHDKANVVRLE